MDTILPNTLNGTTPLPPGELPPIPKGLQVPNMSGNAQTDIRTLQGAQNQPSTLMDFTKVMQLTSQQGYKEKQVSDLESASKQFDPTKVSGGTFASIIQNLEANRGGDTSKIYSATMQAYNLAQSQITSRLEHLQDLEEDRRQHEEEMKMRKKELDRLKKADKASYKIEKAKNDLAKKDWETSYALALKKIKTATTQSSLYSDWDTYVKQYSVET